MLNATSLLSTLPSELRDPLVECYRAICKNFAERRWEPAELNGGKFAEVVFNILSGELSGTFPSSPSKPSNMVDACRRLETYPPDPSRVGDRSLRILIPRVLLSLYEIRNNRGVGHVGGDVSSNHMDAVAVYSMASWVMAELVRVYHRMPTTEAQRAVDVIVERRLPIIWEIDGIRRVLDTKLTKTQQVLALLYVAPSWVNEADLIRDVEYSNRTEFRTKVLLPLHRDRVVLYDTTTRRAVITPNGIQLVEHTFLNAKNNRIL